MTTGEAYGNGQVIDRPHDAPMPTWLIERGFRFGMYSADCAEPPHVHISGHGGRGKIWLDPIRPAYLGDYNPAERALVLRIVAAHAAQFLERWHEFCEPAEQS